MMVLSLSIIVTKGSSLQTQSGILGGFFTTYIDETTAYENTSLSQNQLADINSLVTYPDTTTPQTTTLSTIQDNSIVSRGTILTDIIDGLTDKGNQITTYTVQEGDTLSFIASDFGVSMNTIIWANNLKDVDAISPGIDLKIPPISGVIHKVKKGDTVGSIAIKYGVEGKEIISYNVLPQEGSLREGDEIIVPGGKMPNQKINVPTSNSVARNFAYLPNLSGYFRAPATGYDWGTIHGRNGVDIANSCGTGLYAAAEGTVTVALATDPLGRTGKKMNGGFGKYLKIQHPNGTETLYAHASKILVAVGDFVGQGQQIAVMGTTGRSTGCHVHFEVHGAKNPMAK